MDRTLLNTLIRRNPSIVPGSGCRRLQNEIQQIQIVSYDDVYNICTDNDGVIILALM